MKSLLIHKLLNNNIINYKYNNNMKVEMGSKIKTTLPALKYRNFRLFFSGQAISLIGTWIQNIAQPWLVLTLTDSPFLLSLVVTFQTLPQMVFSLFIGPLIDKVSKKKILIFTQSSFSLLAAILGILTLTKRVEYWHVLVVATMFGFLNTLDMPARQSYMVELVGKDDLMNAIALNSSIFNLARIIGPAIGGILIGFVGIGICFLLNAVSYIAVIAQLLKISAVSVKNDMQINKLFKGLFKDVVEGLKYIFAKERIKVTVTLFGIISIFCMNFSVLIPVFSQNFLKLDSKGFGMLMTAMGVGALVGALFVALSKNSKPKLTTIVIAAFGLSIGEALMFFASNFYLAFLLLVFIGFFMILFTTSVNTTLQLESEDNIRGRVMSVYSFVFVGVAPIGSLYAGGLASKLGANMAFTISGIIGLIGTLLIGYILLKKRKRSNS